MKTLTTIILSITSIFTLQAQDQTNLNLGFIKGNYDDGTVRANLAVMAGTYANANLAAEPGVLKRRSPSFQRTVFGPRPNPGRIFPQL